MVVLQRLSTRYNNLIGGDLLKSVEAVPFRYILEPVHSRESTRDTLHSSPLLGEQEYQLIRESCRSTPVHLLFSY